MSRRISSASWTFQSTPPARGATPGSCWSVLETLLFQSTPPARGATSSMETWTRWRLFQSTPPARGATQDGDRIKTMLLFQSTPPARGATPLYLTMNRGRVFQSTPPARGATADLQHSPDDVRISIHAPREGGDVLDDADYDIWGISIHAPREGGDPGRRLRWRRARHFNPRPPRGGRLPDPVRTHLS